MINGPTPAGPNPAHLPPTGPPSGASGPAPGNLPLAVAARRTQIGGDWFFWIAGFSVVNSLIALFGSSIHFVIGLGTTELFDAVGGQSGTSGKVIAVLLDLLAAAFYVGYGFFARKGAKWAFVTGMVFYLLDAVLLLVFKDWLAVAFHAYALYRIFQGFQAAGELSQLRVQEAAALRASLPPGSTPGVWPPPPLP